LQVRGPIAQQLRVWWPDTGLFEASPAPGGLARPLRSAGGMARDRSSEASAAASSSTTFGAVGVQSPGRALRYVLGGLLGFGALNAFGGGYYGLSGAKGVPVEWLEGSPFRNYWVPSLVLLVLVGGAFLLAALAVLTGRHNGRTLAIGASAIVLGWLVIQVAIIGFVSWMQPATAALGVVILALAWWLPQPGSRRGPPMPVEGRR
jgi:hypothetical protein